MIAWEFLILVYASITDIKTHEVPLYVTPIACIPRLIYLVFTSGITAIVYYCLCAIGIFGVLYIEMKFGNLGGADALLSMSIGLYLGILGIWAVILSLAFSLPYTAWMWFKKDEHEYPFVPFLLLGFSTIILLRGAS